MVRLFVIVIGPRGVQSVSIGNHTASSSISKINLLEWVFQKAEIARAASTSPISAFCKTRKCRLIPHWTRKSLINNINKETFARSKYRKIFLKFIFSHLRKLYHWLKKIFYCLSTNHNREERCVSWCYTFCMKVIITLIALVLHLNCAVLSQSE